MHPCNVMLTKVYIDIVYVLSCTITNYLNLKGADGLPYENGIPLKSAELHQKWKFDDYGQSTSNDWMIRLPYVACVSNYMYINYGM